jgi:hypothetical protein
VADILRLDMELVACLERLELVHRIAVAAFLDLVGMELAVRPLERHMVLVVRRKEQVLERQQAEHMGLALGGRLVVDSHILVGAYCRMQVVVRLRLVVSPLCHLHDQSRM